MKPISPSTIVLVRSLAANPGLLARIFGQPAAPSSAVLDQIVEAGELEAALGLLGAALAGPEAARAPLLAVVDRMVRGAPPEALAWLDLRARILSEWRQEWYWAPEVTVARVRTLARSAASAAGLASLHPSGFVREAAVERLAASDDSLALAFLLIRANDWVAPVQSAAVSGIEAALSRRGAGPFAPWLTLVDRLTGLGRNSLRPLAERILAALAVPDAAEAVREGCRSSSRGVRRRCVEIALAAKTFDLRPVVRAGLDDPDPVVRTLVAKGAAKALSWEELEPLVEPMLASTTPAARYSALDILWTHRRAGAREVLVRSLADSHSHVRGTARWLLKGEAGFDAATAQRAALSKASNADLVGALEGLGEVGDAGDAAWAVPYLGHPRARVRTAAVHLIGAVGGAEHREALIGALSDPSAKVSRAARMLLLRAGAIDPDRITWAALRSSHPHERKGAVDLARAHDYWLAGVLLLRIATRATDAAVVDRASEALQSWENRYNRVFSAPSEALVAEFEALVSRESAIEPAQLTRLRGLVPALRARLRGA